MSLRRPDGHNNQRERRTQEESTMTANATTLTAARAEALFTSPLATGSSPAFDVVEGAIRIAVRAHGGVRGCAGDVAAEYGDHPELAAPRMRWARDVVEQLYEGRRAGRPRTGWALVA
jgi:hypothetical protein